MRKHLTPIFHLVLVVLSGCSHYGFNRGELRAQLNGAAVVDDAAIARALALKPQLPQSFRLGVYFAEPRVYRDAPDWRWTEQDKTKILSAASSLKASHEASDVFVLSSATVSAEDLPSLRLVAAQHGADALLLIKGINDVDRHSNGWAWSYALIAPVFFVPGTVIDSLFLAQAVMWDVRNGFLYLTADAESEKRQTRPAAFTNTRKVSDQARIDAVDKLRDELARQLQGLAAKKS
jgi:hypothetical protein